MAVVHEIFLALPAWIPQEVQFACFLQDHRQIVDQRKRQIARRCPYSQQFLAYHRIDTMQPQITLVWGRSQRPYQTGLKVASRPSHQS